MVSTTSEAEPGRRLGKRISPQAFFAVEEALAIVYWFKADLEKFLRRVMDAPELMSRLSFDQPKRAIAGQLVEMLARDQDRYREQIVDLMGHLAAFEDFNHLARLEDGADKALAANEAVASLRQVYDGYAELTAEREALAARKREMEDSLARQGNLGRALGGLRGMFLELQGESPQARGYGLERLLTELFALWDLDPKSSFRALGEQVDGGFSFDTTDYLLEAKWQEGLVDTADLDTFEGKVSRKLDNTLGLFVAINGFSENAITNHSRTRPRLILMDGADLWAILEGRIALPEALRRKRRHAALTGEIHLTVTKMLG